MQDVHKKLTEGINDYVKKSGLSTCVLGLSGGLDSAVVLKLAIDALGSENVNVLILPEKGVTNPVNINHAKVLSDFLGVHYFSLSINGFLTSYSVIPWEQSNLAYINTKARVRASLLYNFANTYSALVFGTSNKSELLLGYGTKYGDLASDLMPIGDLYKTEVMELADFMGLPREIIDKAPSAELYEGQTDAEELGGSYKEIDPILARRDQGEVALIEKGMNAVLIRSIFRRMSTNEHKLSPPHIISVDRPM